MPLGLNRNIALLRLIMPQMWRHALPGLGNQWLVLLKDTALVSLISVNDLMLQTKTIVNRTQEPFTWYLIVTLTLCALLIAFLLALFLTIILSLKTAIFQLLFKAILRYLPALLCWFNFFIYYGPGQFPALKEYPALWALISAPWVCALLALALNSAAYSTLLFHGAVKAIPKASWQSCQALGMSNYQTLRIILPYTLKRALSSYSNEVILIFKSTSLASTITLLEIMGYSQQIFGQTYNVDVFIAAGIIYLCVNGILTLLMRWLEQYTLFFEKI